jgi:hypothetical protein
MKEYRILNILIFSGIVSVTYAQTDSINVVADTSDKGTAFTKTLSSENAGKILESENVYAVVGRNLRNADGSEMGPFVLEQQDPQSVSNISGSKHMPKPGFDNLGYAKAMRSGKYSKGQEGQKASGNTKAGADKKPEKKSEKKSEKI